MNEPLFSFKNRWFTISVGALLVIFLAAAFVGLVWLPRAHAQDPNLSLWDAICSAAGAPRTFQNAGLPDERAVFPSSVIVSNEMMGPPDAVSVGRGATLALQCSMCHGARGTASSGTDAPHLAGQPPSSTYKQLRDYKSGHRISAVMQPLATNLSDQDMRDLAAFYSQQTRETLIRHAALAPEVPRLVSNGSPMRNIGACATCHSPGVARAATPILDGLPEAYLRKQLEAFKSGRRANDINQQMRNAAHQLTEQEIDLLAKYYASR
ncbi:c-type cytochrome [Massilia sp. TN1-12]|uniref:c-type cytochrome n=1 Tax=Massilia paldalensis TaxID=3377675 RepID=UPI00384E27EF